MAEHNYYVQLHSEGHARVYKDNHLLLGCDVVAIEKKTVSNSHQTQMDATIELACGERLARIKVLE